MRVLQRCHGIPRPQVPLLQGKDGKREVRVQLTEEEYEAGLAQAKKRAEWELGDGSWAGIIIGAFLYPDHDAEGLRLEKEDRA